MVFARKTGRSTLNIRCINVHSCRSRTITRSIPRYSTVLLKLEDLILLVAQLLQDTGQLALVLGADLATADGLV